MFRPSKCQSHREFDGCELSSRQGAVVEETEIAVFSCVTKRESLFVGGVKFVDQLFDEWDVVAFPIMRRQFRFRIGKHPIPELL